MRPPGRPGRRPPTLTEIRTLIDRSIRPAQLLVGGFAAAILAGAFLLTTPLAATGAPVGFVNALFTATSAVCVTGLAVVDTGTVYSLFGQWVILILIQLGGLGIMTYSTLILVLLGNRLSFRGEALFHDTFGRRGRDEAVRLMRHIFFFTLGAELLGAALLFVGFAGRMELSAALYHAVFHSVSAFCNAGFSLNATNLMAYRGDYLVSLTVMGLIVVGGLGFLVMEDVWGAWQDRRAGRRVRLALHTKVVLATTAILLVVGAVGVAVFEYRNALAGLGVGEATLAALFQSVTPRTAGFNTLDYATLTNATLFLTVLLMFVGASPGSCGGGIKTSSAAVVMALFRSRMAGREKVNLFRRSLPDPVVARAVSVLVLSFLFLVIVTFALIVSEGGLRPRGEAGVLFFDLLFEAVSAFGTVGLSTGVTPGLTDFGKLLLTLVMFVGRVGPLTLAMAVGVEEAKGRFRYAEESLMVG